MSHRKIIHVDMDAFYASVEQLDHPELRGRPVIVGGRSGRGVVATASYEARKFGVRSAMPSSQAARLCPQAVFMSPRFSRYREISQKIRGIFLSVTDRVEPLSLDEAFLDVTENMTGLPLARDVAFLVKRRIFEETGLTASAGVAPLKFVAKIASDMRKPNGLVVIPPHRVQDFIKNLPVEKLWGVGPATGRRLRDLGFRTAGDIRAWSSENMREALGKQGVFIHRLANGIDDREVSPRRGGPKSRSVECTFETDMTDLEDLKASLRKQVFKLADDPNQRLGRTVTVKIRFKNFETITRSKTLRYCFQSGEELYWEAEELLVKGLQKGEVSVRLLGVGLSGFDEPLQLSLDF